jgi:hypothetical protein
VQPGMWPHKDCCERRAHFDKPPHPVTGCVLEVLVLLVTTLHQSGECVVVELVGATLLLRSPYIFSEAAAAIRAFILVFFTIVVFDASAKQRRIRLFLMWLNVFLDVANLTRCDAVTTRAAEAWRIERTMMGQNATAAQTFENMRWRRALKAVDSTRVIITPGSAKPCIDARRIPEHKAQRGALGH